jgi:hypothetical protein
MSIILIYFFFVVKDFLVTLSLVLFTLTIIVSTTPGIATPYATSLTANESREYKLILSNHIYTVA